MDETVIKNLIILFAILFLFLRIGRRSGVSDEDLKQTLPGDDIIPDAGYIADRATILHAPVTTVWPWIVQLGKDRAGWYAPKWLELIFVWNPRKRIKREIQPEFQKLKVGDVVPDWGPGSLKALSIKPHKYLLYGAIKPGDPKDTYFFSWIHTLEQVDENTCRLYTRLRIRKSKGILNLLMIFGGAFDWATMVAMYAGLKEILE